MIGSVPCPFCGADAAFAFHSVGDFDWVDCLCSDTDFMIEFDRVAQNHIINVCRECHEVWT